MFTHFSLIVLSFVSSVAMALPNDFAGLKLGQDLEASKKFFLALGHNIIYPDGKIIWAKGEKSFKPDELQRQISAESKTGQICTVTIEPLLPKSKMPAIETFNCGVVKNKENAGNVDRVIDTYIVSHYLDEKGKGEKAFYLTYMFNMSTVKPAGAGLIGKLGEPDTESTRQACPPFIKGDRKYRKSGNNCFVTIWLAGGSESMATAIGHGTNLRHGNVARLEIWDLDTQKKVEANKATKAADDLGF